ncbi:hypothetical protein [Pseudooctadecabacter sp.]|uniref:hypothetical protein n=1 Tax=Pseudooctadecabacter sp. TaxID=1966338 RepID=UPI0035C821D4
MRCLTAILALMPLTLTAGDDLHPRLFNYDATLATCISDPNAPDLAQSCADALTSAYILRRAIARAAALCTDLPLQDCPAPFEDEGLPAIAVRIATDVGCDATPVADLDGTPLSPDHCISIAADIMFDEGVVPLDTGLACIRGHDCADIAALNAAFWTQTVTALASDDPTIRDLQTRNATACAAEATPTATQTCIATRSTDLWADMMNEDR